MGEEVWRHQLEALEEHVRLEPLQLCQAFWGITILIIWKKWFAL